MAYIESAGQGGSYKPGSYTNYVKATTPKVTTLAVSAPKVTTPKVTTPAVSTPKSTAPSGSTQEQAMALAKANTSTGYRPISTDTKAATPVTTQPAAQQTTDPNAEMKQYIQDLFNTYIPQTQPQQPAKPDFSGTINSWKDSARSSLMSKIDSALQSGLSQYANAGALAQQNASSALNQNDVERAKALQKVYDASEAAGQGRGGMNVSGQIAVNTQAQQGANQINQDMVNYLNEVENARNTLKTQADTQKTQASADIESQALQELMDSEKFGYDYGLSKSAQDLANKQFNFNSNLQTKQFNADEAWKEWQKQWETEQAAWQRSADNPNVQAQVLSNKAQLLSNQMATLELQNYPEEQKLKLQQLRKDIDQIGKSPAISDYDRQMNNIKLEQARIELDNMKNGLTKSGGIPSGQASVDTNTKISAIRSELDVINPVDAYTELLNNSADYVNDIGRVEYDNLVESYKRKANMP